MLQVLRLFDPASLKTMPFYMGLNADEWVFVT